MTTLATDIKLRSATELDLDDISAIDEKITGSYQPDAWERRLTYYLRRDPDASIVAELEGRVVGFMLGELRSGEFGLEDPTGWVEVLGVDPSCRGMGLGQRLATGMFEHFKLRGATTVRTLVDDERQDLTAFFRALGFEPSTLRPFVKSL